ncbi:hypothetical protein, conserved [Trypanosoma brucei brucei TREU927]|uniref:Uncharacterized protein n=1 Tax=Trypanosoma brucei brucei (strain 927/4 GUTat10.1) TaxID=185431 RepID=Q57UP3_TRYB2|nr:hypothetical protein, conserved [Trypanosoma brucei brucei TREU927]AAX70676.1 hypothetical protein, conserved [Trypanosoma brucei]AAZ12477.1 hypothetical protein, conserved [Trypanosoma brucei brucei TREU927]
MGNEPFLLFRGSELLPGFPSSRPEGNLAQPDEGDVERLPTHLIPIEPLTHSVVRVVCHSSTRAGMSTPLAQMCALTDVRRLLEEERDKCVETARSWEGLCALHSHYPHDHATGCMPIANEELDCVASSLSLDESFVKEVLRSKLWRVKGNAESADGKVEPDLKRLKIVVSDLCQLLWHHRDGEGSISTDGVAVPDSSERCEVVRREKRKASKVEAKSVLSIIAGLTKDSLDELTASHGSVEPLLVGLVFSEVSEETCNHSGGETVGTLVGDDLLRLFDKKVEATVENKDGYGDTVDFSARVLLLNAVMERKNMKNMAHASPMWSALLSVVNFVYVTGDPATVRYVAQLINHVQCLTQQVTAEPAPRPHSKVDISLFYTPLMGVENEEGLYPSGARCVSNLKTALSEAVVGVANKKRWKPEAFSPGGSGGFQDLLQWSLMLEHVWHHCGSAPCHKVSRGIEQWIGMAVETAADIFASTAEALLLSMYVMEPLPPVCLPVADNTETAVKSVAGSPGFSVGDVLLSAHRVSLLVFGAVVGPCASDNPLLRREALEDLYGAHLKASEAVRGRLERFCARQAERTVDASPALKNLEKYQSQWSKTVELEQGKKGDSLARILYVCMEGMHHILSTPLIKHCDVPYDLGENAIAGVDGWRCSGATTSCVGRTTTNCGYGAKVNQRCQVTESPITSSWASAAKSSAICNFTMQRLLPMLLHSLGQQPVVLNGNSIVNVGTRRAVQSWEDQRMQLEGRCRAAEAMIEHQRCVIGEIRNQRSALGNRLREAQRCMRKLVMMCVGYEEGHASYAQKLAFRLKYSLEEDITSIFVPIEVKPVAGSDAWDGGETSQQSSPSPLVCGEASMVAPLAGRDDLRRLMFRDAQMQLDACHNVVRCVCQEARENLNTLSAAMMECSISYGNVSPNESLRAMFSTSLYGTRTNEPSGGYMPPTGDQECDCDGSNQGDMYQKDDSKHTYPSTIIKVPLGLSTHNNNHKNFEGKNQPRGRALEISSNESRPLSHTGKTTWGSRDEQIYQHEKQQTLNTSTKRRYVSTPSASRCSSRDIVAVIQSPKPSKAAIDAIAHLQKKHAEGKSHHQHLKKQYEDTCLSLVKTAAEFQENIARQKIEQTCWSEQNKILLAFINTTVRETQISMMKQKIEKERTLTEEDSRKLATDRRVLDLSKVYFDSLNEVRESMAEHYGTLMCECKTVLSNANATSYEAHQQLAEEIRARELATDRRVLDLSKVYFDSLNEVRESMAEHYGTLMCECKTVLSNANATSYEAHQQLAEETRARELATDRRVLDLSKVYFESLNEVRESMAEHYGTLMCECKTVLSNANATSYEAHQQLAEETRARELATDRRVLDLSKVYFDSLNEVRESMAEHYDTLMCECKTVLSNANATSYEAHQQLAEEIRARELATDRRVLDLSKVYFDSLNEVRESMAEHYDTLMCECKTVLSNANATSYEAHQQLAEETRARELATDRRVLDLSKVYFDSLNEVRESMAEHYDTLMCECKTVLSNANATSYEAHQQLAEETRARELATDRQVLDLSKVYFDSLNEVRESMAEHYDTLMCECKTVLSNANATSYEAHQQLAEETRARELATDRRVLDLSKVYFDSLNEVRESMAEHYDTLMCECKTVLSNANATSYEAHQQLAEEIRARELATDRRVLDLSKVYFDSLNEVRESMAEHYDTLMCECKTVLSNANATSYEAHQQLAEEIRARELATDRRVLDLSKVYFDSLNEVRESMAEHYGTLMCECKTVLSNANATSYEAHQQLAEETRARELATDRRVLDLSKVYFDSLNEVRESMAEHYDTLMCECKTVLSNANATSYEAHQQLAEEIRARELATDRRVLDLSKVYFESLNEVRESMAEHYDTLMCECKTVLSNANATSYEAHQQLAEEIRARELATDRRVLDLSKVYFDSLNEVRESMAEHYDTLMCECKTVLSNANATSYEAHQQLAEEIRARELATDRRVLDLSKVYFESLNEVRESMAEHYGTLMCECKTVLSNANATSYEAHQQLAEETRARELATDRRVLDLSKVYFESLNEVRESMAEHYDTLMCECKTVLSNANATSYEAHQQLAEETRARELATDRQVLDLSKVYFESLNEVRESMAEHYGTLMCECKTVLSNANATSYEAHQQLAEETRARELATDRRVLDLSKVYFDCAGVLCDAVFKKCIFFGGVVFDICRDCLVPMSICSSVSLGGVYALGGIDGLVYEMELRKRRIAELEECVRQKHIVITSLKESIANLYGLLEAQRDLGMVAPPPPPLVSREFGVLNSSAKEAVAYVNSDASFSSTFFASPSRVLSPGVNDGVKLKVCPRSFADEAVLSAETVGGAFTSSNDHHVAVGGVVGHEANRTDQITDEGERLQGWSLPIDRKEMRPVSWYLQSIAAIESTLKK